jgi:hypothetical protein
MNSRRDSLYEALVDLESSAPAGAPPRLGVSSRRPWAVGAGILVAAAALAGFVIGSGALSGPTGMASPSPTPTLTSPTASDTARATPTPSPSPVATPVPTPSPTSAPTPRASAGVTWTMRAEFGVTGEDVSAAAMTTGDGLMVLVGRALLEDERQPNKPAPREGRVWLSRDGRSWEPIVDPETFKDAVIYDVIRAADGAFIALGWLDPVDGPITQNVAWRSVDGRTWSRIDLGLPDDFHSGRDIAAGPAGFVAGGTRFPGGRHQLWFSADGIEWMLVEDFPPFDSPGARSIQHVIAGPEGFVATGTPEGAGHLYIMASGNGIDWFDAPGQAALTELPAVPLLAPLGGDWIATGRGDPVIVFRSANGLDWSLLNDVEPVNGLNTASALLSTGDRLFLEASAPFLSGPTWTSTDGRSWVETDLPVNAEPRVATLTESEYLLVVDFYDEDARRRSIQVWSSPSR